MAQDLKTPVERRLMEISTGVLEVFLGGPMDAGEPILCAAHPAGVFAESAAVCINPRGIGQSSAPPSGKRSYTLESMVDDLEAVRRKLGVQAWVFWGMSGGGGLGLAYALQRPDALRGLIVEGVCSCFRLRLADPQCIL
jgi:pimeloyl-ACP methyl ester carboxylesterase